MKNNVVSHKKNVVNMRLLQSSQAFIRNYSPPDYLLDGILQRRYLYALTGQTTSGKTAVLLLLAAYVALNKGAFGGRELGHGRVLYLAGENPDDVRMRWIAMADRMGFDPNDIDVYWVEGRHSLKQNIDLIKQEVRRIGDVVLVIVDTAAAYFEGDGPGGDENSNVDAGMYARRLRTLTTLAGGPTVIVSCHPTKNAQAKEELVPRGGSAFLFEVDGNLTAIRNDTFVELHQNGRKWRGPEFLDPIMFEVVRDVTTPKLVDSKDRMLITVIAKELTSSEYREKQQEIYSDENAVLIVMARTPDASVAEIAQACGWFFKDGVTPYRSKVQRVHRSLEKSKLIKKARGGRYELTPEGEKTVKKLGTGSGTGDATDTDDQEAK
jgi:AAA domain